MNRVHRLPFKLGQASDLAELLKNVAALLGREAKRKALHDLVRKHGITLADALAIGDGANDLSMIGDAGLGVAYRAKPVVAAAAATRLDHSDLEAVLFLQGYRDNEIDRN